MTCEGHVQVGSGWGGVVILGLEKEVSGVRGRSQSANRLKDC